MSSLSQRDRRALDALRRRVEHSARQHAANIARAVERLPRELDEPAEKMLELPRGTLTRWRGDDDELVGAVERIVDWLAHDGHERRNGGSS